MAKDSRIQIVAEPGKQEVTIRRTFNAPRALVFRAHTDPGIILQWWGPRHLTTKIEKMEVKPGGYWRFVQRDAQGNEYPFHGAFHSVESPERIVQTFEFEGMPGHVSLDTLTLEEKDGKTVLTSHSVFQSVEDRDGMLASGMESGMTESYERLDEVLASERVAVR